MIELAWVRKGKNTICTEPIIADIETSHTPDYKKTWMVTCQLKFAGKYEVVRTPSAFIEYLKDQIDKYNLTDERRIAVYFHNMSFDLSYLLPFIQKMLPGYENRHGLYDGRNRIINYVQGCFEFRCSYLLSSASLENWGKEMNAEHRKKVGLYDYERMMYQDEVIDEDSQLYDMYDVLCLEDSLRAQLKAYHDNMSTIPLTSTGYVRRILRNSCKDDPDYRNDVFLRSRITADCFNLCIQAYAGGYTHMNRFYKGVTVKPAKKKNGKGKWTIKHRDFRSHYPSQIRHYKMPWGSACLFYTIEEYESFKNQYGHYITPQDLFDMYPDYTTISTIRVTDMKLRDYDCTMPFMQISKIMEKSPGFKLKNDNGRLIKSTGSFTMHVDNLTLQTLVKQYTFGCEIIKVYRFTNTECPPAIARVIDDLFKKKSDYKIEHKRCQKEYGENDQRTIDAEFNLMQTKKLLNAIYGCMATSPIRDDCDLDFISFYEGVIEDPYISKHAESLEEKEVKLEKYYKSRNSFLPYQVGIMTTALARYELLEFIETIGYENCLYCDTDSIFYISDEEIEKKVEALNAEKNKTAPYIINSKDEIIYYDVFEDEPDLEAFRGLHSKCYASIIYNEKLEKYELSATIAGVPKRTIVAMNGEEPIYLTREEELAGITPDDKINNEDEYNPFDAIQNLVVDHKFTVNTGFTASYIHEKPHVEVIDGHVTELAGGCIIRKLSEKYIHDKNYWDYDFDFSPIYIEGNC